LGCTTYILKRRTKIMYKTSDTNQPPTCHNEEMPDESINQDQTIVARVVNGDVDAYGELMERYESKPQKVGPSTDDNYVI